MNNSNYYVAVDENGQPYIAHALFRSSASSDGGGRGKRGGKYLMKVDNWFKNGKAAYAYTQAQVRWLMGQGRQKAKNAIDKATGVSARNKRDKLATAYRNAQLQTQGVAKNNPTSRATKSALQNELQRANEEYGKTFLGRVEHFIAASKVRNQIFKDNAKKTLASIRETMSDKMKYGKAKATVETRAAAYHLKKHANDTLANVRDILSKAESQANFRGKQIATRAGVAERELNKAANNVKTGAVNTANNIKSQANFRGKQIATRAGVAERELNKAANNVKTGAVNTANNIKTRANEIIKNATKGGNIKEQRDALLSAYNQAKAGKHPDDRALAAALQKELNRVNKEYEKTWKYQAEMGKKKLETRAKSVF